MAATTTGNDQAAVLTFRDEAFIEGRFVPSASGQRFDSINPATDQLLTSVASCEAEDVDRAVKAARRSFEGGVWSRAAPNERRLVLRRLADLIREHAEEFALLDSLDMGKPVNETFTAWSARSCPGTTRWTCARGSSSPRTRPATAWC